MSQITLNQTFVVQQQPLAEKLVAELLITIPTDKVFAQLPNYPAVKLQNLTQRAEKLQALQIRLKDATIHQKRDRVTACIAGAIMAGLVAGIVLGTLFCPPVAIASIITLFVFGFANSIVVEIAAEKDHRNGYEMIKYADLLCVGIPRRVSHLLTRKSSLQNKVNPLQVEMGNDLLSAGQYLQKHIPAIRAKLESDIENTKNILENARKFGIQADLSNLDKVHQDSVAILKELNEKGQPMVDRMIEAGIILTA
jgi:hypothetical protein